MKASLKWKKAQAAGGPTDRRETSSLSRTSPLAFESPRLRRHSDEREWGAYLPAPADGRLRGSDADEDHSPVSFSLFRLVGGAAPSPSLSILNEFSSPGSPRSQT